MYACSVDLRQFRQSSQRRYLYFVVFLYINIFLLRYIESAASVGQHCPKLMTLTCSGVSALPDLIINISLVFTKGKETGIQNFMDDFLVLKKMIYEQILK